jgi:hypothetical protein
MWTHVSRKLLVRSEVLVAVIIMIIGSRNVVVGSVAPTLYRYFHQKCWYLSARVYGNTSQKAVL